MTRTLHIHLDVQIPDEDDRPTEELTELISDSLESGLDNAPEGADGISFDLRLSKETEKR